MNQPYFGGVQRTESEVRLMDDRILPLAANDLMWELALPEGCHRDHEYSNPMAGNGGSSGGKIGRLQKCLVRGYGGDPLVDRQREFAGMLKGCGVEVVADFDEGGSHAAELFDMAKAKDLYKIIQNFINDSSSSSQTNLVINKSTV